MQESQKEYMIRLEKRRRALRAKERGQWKCDLEMSLKWHLTPLATLRLSLNDWEIRFWNYGGIFIPMGTRLRYRSGVWSGAALLPVFGKAPTNAPNFQAPLAPPRCGWAELIRRLRALRMETLPDQDELWTLPPLILDGNIRAVELRQGKAYHSYHYSNPGMHWCPEASYIERQVCVLGEQLPRPRELLE
jgi:hypothetical protein